MRVTPTPARTWLSHPCPYPRFYREALYEEQVKHFGTPDGRLRDMVYDDIRELKILDAVVRETLRVHAPVILSVRM